MRTARLSAPEFLTHIIVRFVDRDWFVREEYERQKYLDYLGRALSDSDWRCLAYALMSSHFHLAMIAGVTPMESWTRRVNSPFARWLNLRHERLGPVLADRPGEWAMPPLNERRVIAYIHNNPVAAGVVRRASASSWTSHRAYLGKAPRPPWLFVQEGLVRCGFEPHQTREFDRWVHSSRGDELEHVPLSELRRAARAQGLVEVGTPILTTPPRVPLVARDGAIVRVHPRELVPIVLSVTGVDLGELCSRTSKRRAVSARRVAVHVARRQGITASSIASLLGISAQAASQLSLSPLSATETSQRDMIERRAARECSGNWPR